MRRPVSLKHARGFILAAILGLGLAVGSQPAPVRAADWQLPAVVDLTQDQTPIRQQGPRGTCTFHPEVEALEAAYHRRGIDVSLSVEHLIWNARSIDLNDKIDDVNTNENNLANLPGGSMIERFRVLSQYGISREQDMPYRLDYDRALAGYFRGFDVADFRSWEPFPQIALNRFNLDPHQFTQSARQNAKYGIKSYVVLSSRDQRDPRKLEEILAAGYEIGIGLDTRFERGTADAGRGNIPPVVWYRAPGAVVVGPHWHAMLLVGYDHARRFFIVKNSWGPNVKGYAPAELPDGWKDIAKYRGFTLIHYSYLAGATHGAAYFTDVVDPAGNRFRRQRVMGLWNVEFKQKSTGRKVASAVLAWRRLPGTDPKIAGDMRIGDFYCGGKQYRVNAQLTGNDPLAAYLYIDFRHPQTPAGEARGVRFYAVASLADNKPARMEITQAAANGNAETLFDVPTDDLVASAEQAIDENPLMPIPTPNLLVNGSFEDGPSGKPVMSQDLGSTAINGWTVTRGPVAYIASKSWCDLGNRCLALHGPWGNGGVAQTFPTTAGRRYRLTFSLTGAQGMTPAANLVAATAAGQHQLFSFHATEKSAMHTKWSTKQWEFTATAAATTLEIYALTNHDPECGAAVDDVRVAPVVR